MMFPLTERKRITDAARHPRVVAFGWMTRACEGTKADGGYAALYGWRPGRTDRVITDFSDHPRVKFWPSGQRVPAGVKPAPYSFTTAAGAYQATGSTWNDFIRDMGPHDFSPQSQDVFFAWCLNRTKSLDLVMTNSDEALKQAIVKCSGTWASFPFNTATQPHKTLAFCFSEFHAALGATVAPVAAPRATKKSGTGGAVIFGGNISSPDMEEEEPAAQQPTEGAAMSADQGSSIMGTIGNFASNAAPVAGAFNPIAGLAMGLVGSLINAFSPLAREKISKEINRHTDNPQVGQMVADSILQTAQQLTQKNDPVQATAAAMSSPEVMAQLEQAATAKLEEITPLLDKIAAYEQAEFERGEQSINAAAARQLANPATQQLASMLAKWTLIMMMAFGLILAVGLAVQVVLDASHTPDPTLTTLTGTVLGAIIGSFNQINQHVFGSSTQSKAKDTTIAELASRRQHGVMQ